MTPYDIFKHGVNVTVRNKHTRLPGVVVEIRETAHEVIEPFVLYVGKTNPTKESTYNLEFIDDGRKRMDQD